MQSDSRRGAMPFSGALGLCKWDCWELSKGGALGCVRGAVRGSAAFLRGLRAVAAVEVEVLGAF